MSHFVANLPMTKQSCADDLVARRRARPLLHGLRCPESAESSRRRRKSSGLQPCRRGDVVPSVSGPDIPTSIASFDGAKLTRGTSLIRSIVDDGYKHTLMVNEDRRNAGVRLVTAVWDGELRKCPVWTAFGTYQQMALFAASTPEN